MSADCYIGIDLGTSGIKITVSDTSEVILASASRQLAVHREQDGWSEQHPDDWWSATLECLDELAVQKALMQRVASIGLSGQMLGPVHIDRDDRAIRRVLLWNDGRSVRECEQLQATVPDIGLRTNGTPDPGLGAPKLLWLAEHEPHIIEETDCLLLPKDFIRLRLTGERASEPSDAGGIMLMEVADSVWSESLCTAAGWSLDRLPPLVWSWESAGGLMPALATRFGLAPGLPVAGGAGDNMACSLGVGVAQPSDCAITLGTSGVMCTVDRHFRPLPDQAFLTSHHAAPDVFLSMGVVMSATSSVDWLTSVLGQSIDTLTAAIDTLYSEGRAWQAPICAPWFNGNRTPHNRPAARGRFSEVGLSTDAAMLGYSVLEGVAFQMKECRLAQQQAGIEANDVTMVGGGSRNRLWCQMIASLLQRPVTIPTSGDVAACLGAARLARVAAGHGSTSEVLSQRRQTVSVIEPDGAMTSALAERFERYQALVGSIN